jgi:hypothetical protein
MRFSIIRLCHPRENGGLDIGVHILRLAPRFRGNDDEGVTEQFVYYTALHSFCE